MIDKKKNNKLGLSCALAFQINTIALPTHIVNSSGEERDYWKCHQSQKITE